MNYRLHEDSTLKEGETALGFVFYRDRLLVEMNDGKSSIPLFEDIIKSDISLVRSQYLGEIRGLISYSGELDTDKSIPKNMELIGLRQLFGIIEEDIFWMAGKAVQIVDWDRTHQYCGQCGHTTETKSDENAKECPKCGLINYPRISPAIIVAITKGNEILLAQSTRFTSNFYSVLAGFVEPGETLEECVRREVKEEVGIDIKNISYFGSQPWPFPNSLMVGFTAEHDKGEISIDEKEIREARWFSVNNLPPIPSSISIARRLIDWFVDSNR